MICVRSSRESIIGRVDQNGGYFMGPGVNADHGAYSRLWRVSSVLAASGAP